MDQNYINYLKEEVERHVSLCMKGESTPIHTNGQRAAMYSELSCYRRHIRLLMNALKKLGVSESERQSLVTPILK